MILYPDDGDFAQAFIREHKREFAFTFPGRPIVVDDVRVRGIGKSLSVPPEAPEKELQTIKTEPLGREKQDGCTTVYFSDVGHVSTPVFFLDKLCPGKHIEGPAMIIDATQTIVVEPHASATVLSRHVVLNVASTRKELTAAQSETLEVDPIRLSVFGHRFMSVADQMSRMFQKTSVSTNIKGIPAQKARGSLY